MIFTRTNIPGALVIRPERKEDERGFFARTYCIRELREHGIDPEVVQRSIAYNRRGGTLRGMHYQAPPNGENKFVTCVRGSVYDVIVDLRADSPSFRTWTAVTLTADSFETLFIPNGCAHGYITLSDDATLHYDISAFFRADSARGLRYDDPAIGIQWPMKPTVISARDLAFPPLSL